MTHKEEAIKRVMDLYNGNSKDIFVKPIEVAKWCALLIINREIELLKKIQLNSHSKIVSDDYFDLLKVKKEIELL